MAIDMAIERPSPQDNDPLPPKKPTDKAGYEKLGRWAGRRLPHVQTEVA